MQTGVSFYPLPRGFVVLGDFPDQTDKCDKFDAQRGVVFSCATAVGCSGLKTLRYVYRVFLLQVFR